MRKNVAKIVLCLLVSCCVYAVSPLEPLYQKVPDQTLIFAATTGMDNVKGDFDKTILGQIAGDPQVIAFFNQVIEPLKKQEEFKKIAPEKYIAFAKELLRSPTIAGIMLNPSDSSEVPYVFLVSETVGDTKSLDVMLEALIAPQLESKAVTKEEKDGRITYQFQQGEALSGIRLVRSGKYLVFAANDPDQFVVKSILGNSSNSALSRKMAVLKSDQNAFVTYVDFTKLLSLLRKEADTDTDAKQILEVFRLLGMEGLQEYIAGVGFEGQELVSYGKINMSSTGVGIWRAFSPADRSLLSHIDAKASQGTVVHVAPGILYDCILNTIRKVSVGTDNPNVVDAQIAGIEQQLGFKLREELLGSIDGSFLSYVLPQYTMPELPMGGYVLAARLKNPQQFESCMHRLGQFIAPFAQGQFQIASQTTPSGKQVHVWAVSFLAMAQVLPAWAIEDDLVVIASHPKLAGAVLDQLASGQGETLMKQPAFSQLTQSVPSDAFAIVVADSKAQARQFMLMLQQYWPMINMGMMNKGIQLPVMLPSIDTYIEKMKPSLQYVRKTPQGLEFYYKGTGMEASPGSIAVGAGAMAILMPALSKTKKIAQRVVCGTNLKGLSVAMMVYCNDYDDMLPVEHWCDLLIEEADVSPKSFVCPETDAIEGESSYAMNKHVAGKKLGELPPDTVLLFETDKGIEEGPRSASIKTRRHYAFLNEFDNVYEEETMVYKECFNQLGGPDDVVARHHQEGGMGCNIAFADGHVEFVTQDRIADLRWTVD